MKTHENLKKIENNAVKMGDIAYKEYLKTNSIESLKGAIRSYNTALKAVHHQLMYNLSKKKKL